VPDFSNFNEIHRGQSLLAVRVLKFCFSLDEGKAFVQIFPETLLLIWPEFSGLKTESKRKAIKKV
jgi:hypothetical protein